jgi:hypothetical protein
LYIEKEYIGNLDIPEGAGTLTIHIRGKEHDQFIHHHLLIEKLLKE